MKEPRNTAQGYNTLYNTAPPGGPSINYSTPRQHPLARSIRHVFEQELVRPLFHHAEGNHRGFQAVGVCFLI